MSATQNGTVYGWTTTRLEALSDGVLAIVMTLLVLDFGTIEHNLAELSRGSASEIVAELCKMSPHVLGYALSFFLIGVAWLTHHTIFQYIRRTDLGLLCMNLLFLMAVAFLPFPTGLLAECIGHDSNVIVVLYGASHLIASLSLLALWLYASHDDRLIDASTSPASIHKITFAVMSRPALYAIGIGLSFFSTTASIVFLWLTPVAYLMLGNRAGLWANWIEVVDEPPSASPVVAS